MRRRVSKASPASSTSRSPRAARGEGEDRGDRRRRRRPFGAELELRISGRSPVNIPLQLITQGPDRAAISHVLDLGKIGVNEGDHVSYRLVATDNRRVPEAKLEPQRTYFPADGGWAELKVQRDAAPLKQQEIVAQKDAIEDRLRHVSELLDKQQRALRSLRQEIGQREVLKFDQADRIDELRGRVGESAEAARRIGPRHLDVPGPVRHQRGGARSRRARRPPRRRQPPAGPARPEARPARAEHDAGRQIATRGRPSADRPPRGEQAVGEPPAGAAEDRRHRRRATGAGRRGGERAAREARRDAAAGSRISRSGFANSRTRASRCATPSTPCASRCCSRPRSGPARWNRTSAA